MNLALDIRVLVFCGTPTINNIFLCCACGWKISAMVTGEFYTKKDKFPGFGRPFVFYAETLQKFVKIFSEHFQIFGVHLHSVMF